MTILNANRRVQTKEYYNLKMKQIKIYDIIFKELITNGI